MNAGIIPIYLIFFLIGDISLASKEKSGLDNSSYQDYAWRQSDTSVALIDGVKTIWQLNYSKFHGKPYFYPLNTSDGLNLVWLRPKDHPWHYGLWFSWKFINSKNFWEEDINTRESEGKSTITEISKTLSDDFSAIVKIHLSYSTSGSNGILHEKRTISISAPDSQGNYFIDWDLCFTTETDTVVLDRTPPEKFGGPTYGGYAGLSFRASQNMTRHLYMDSNNWTNEGDLIGHGEKAKWMDLSGIISGSKRRSGLTMFNHPQNNNELVPWYVFKKGDFAFFNAGVLFNEPIVIPPNKEMNLKYRVLVHSHELTGSEIDGYYKKYTD